MTIFDWKTPAQAKVYTDAADRKRMAGQAMPLLAAGRTENENWPTASSASDPPQRNQTLNPPDGRSGGTRTPNPRFWRPVLWPIELHSYEAQALGYRPLEARPGTPMQARCR